MQLRHLCTQPRQLHLLGCDACCFVCMPSSPPTSTPMTFWRTQLLRLALGIPRTLSVAGVDCPPATWRIAANFYSPVYCARTCPSGCAGPARPGCQCLPTRWTPSGPGNGRPCRNPWCGCPFLPHWPPWCSRPLRPVRWNACALAPPSGARCAMAPCWSG